jgi:hypothetical protein
MGEAPAQIVAREGSALGLAAHRVELLDQLGPSPAFHETSIHTLYCDLAQPGAAAALVNQTEAAMGVNDLLLPNTGAVREEHLLDSDEQASRQMLEVNIWSGYSATRAALLGMLERRSGHIANVASLCAYAHLPLSSAYSASKAAMASLAGARERASAYGRRDLDRFRDHPNADVRSGPTCGTGDGRAVVSRNRSGTRRTPPITCRAKRQAAPVLTAAAKAVVLSMRPAPQWTDAAVAHIYRRLLSEWLGRS